jgi:hypothetical protein
MLLLLLLLQLTWVRAEKGIPKAHKKMIPSLQEDSAASRYGRYGYHVNSTLQGYRARQNKVHTRLQQHNHVTRQHTKASTAYR